MVVSIHAQVVQGRSLRIFRQAQLSNMRLGNKTHTLIIQPTHKSGMVYILCSAGARLLIPTKQEV